jgi:hypothetical protein
MSKMQKQARPAWLSNDAAAFAPDWNLRIALRRLQSAVQRIRSPRHGFIPLEKKERTPESGHEQEAEHLSERCNIASAF